MTSGEHPDMSGNPADATVECHWCYKYVQEDKAYGSELDDEALFCSEECAEEWEFSIMEPDDG